MFPDDWKKLPIPLNKQNDVFGVLVEAMLDLNKRIQTAKGNEKEQLERQIEKTDKEIDDMVYKLYSITGKEREIIEKSISN